MRSKVKRDLMGIVGAVALYALLMGLIESEVIGAFWQLNIVLICINVILAVSLNLITGFTGQFSIGHAGFMAVGAYLSAVMTVKLGLPYIVGILAGAAGAAILGFAIGLPTLRLKGDYLAIAKTDKTLLYIGSEVLKSQHAGYTDDEIYVPLIVINKCREY